MSAVFVPSIKESALFSTTETVQKMLEENAQLIQIIYEYQIKGRMVECVEYQKVLHRNIVYLAKLSDLGSTGPVSLPTQGIQIDSVPGSHMTHMHSSGQVGSFDTMSGHGCQQDTAQIQGQNMTDYQSIASVNQPQMSAGHPGDFGQMPHGCGGQNSDLMTQQQQLTMPQEQPILLHSSPTLGDTSYSLPPLPESNHMVVVQPMDHQGGYHGSAAAQQEYTPQQHFSEHLDKLPQYTELLPRTSTPLNQCGSSQQVQDGSQSYVPYSRQRIKNSEDISHQQQNRIDGAENQAEEAGQQGSVSGCVRELEGGNSAKEEDLSCDGNVTHYDMPNLANR